MPRFTADPTGPVPSTFHFSAIDIGSLGATEYTLVGLVTDCSGSVTAFAREEEAAIKAIVEACQKSPRADNLMLRYTTFDSRLTENHGFKLLADCNPTDYDSSIRPGGATALFDATIDGVDAITRFGKQLTDQDFDVNGILFVLTDGDDNVSKLNVAEVKRSFERAVPSETIESLVTILIGVNVTDPRIDGLLKQYAADAGFTQYVNIGEATAAKLAKLAAFVSRSISSQSQALGSGGPSQALPTF